MPRTKLDRGYQNRLMQERIYGKMRRQGITQAMVARKLGCTQSALSKKITAMSFSLEELRIVFRELGFSDKEILESMRKES